MAFTLSRTERKRLRGVIAFVEEMDFPSCVSGWHRICKRGPVYLNKGEGIVIKRPNFILNPWTPLKVRVTTIKLTEDWVAQPALLKEDTELAVEIIQNQLGKVFCDLHKWNVGWIKENGKMTPKMFDW